MSLMKSYKRVLFNHLTNHINRYLASDSSIQPDASSSFPKKVEDKQTQPTLLEKLSRSEKTKEKSARKGPFKYYFEDEERDKSKIVFYENFFGIILN